MSNLIIVDGINVRRDMAGRYCLNDLHGPLVEGRHKPPYWLRNAQTEQLIAELQICDSGTQPVNVLRGGTEQGTYVCKRIGLCLCDVDQSFIQSESDPHVRCGGRNTAGDTAG